METKTSKRRLFTTVFVLSLFVGAFLLAMLLTPSSSRAQQGGGGSGSNNENADCVVSSTSTNCSEGSVVLSNVVVNPSNACIGSAISASVSQGIIPGQVIIDTSYTNANPNATNPTCNDTFTTNNPSPTIVSNWWTVSVGSFSTNGTGLSASFTPTSCGSGSITFNTAYQDVCDTNQNTTSASGGFQVTQVTLDANQIWFFHYLTPDGYVTQTTANLCGVPSGATIIWHISGPAGFWGSGSNVTSITIYGTGASGANNDVAVYATVNGTQTCPVYLTVFSPTSQENYAVRDTSYGSGYESDIIDEIKDQFGNVLPSIVPWNEDIDGSGYASTAEQVTAAAIADYTGENWGWGPEGGADVDPSAAVDGIVRVGEGTPPNTNPSDPLGSTKVDHSPGGAWYCGGTLIGSGVNVASCVWQMYTDHGRHRGYPGADSF
jgi:hypothetical protein